MNRTLLLILCDFLLLTLLALTRWETAEPERPEQAAVATNEGEEAATTAADDIVELMRLSFEDQQAEQQEMTEEMRAREEALAAELQAREEELAARETAVAQLESNLSEVDAQRQDLSLTLDATREAAARLQQRVDQATGDAAASRARVEQLQRDLEAREKEAERQAAELANLAEARAQAEEKIQDLNVAVRVAEQEKTMLRETAETFRQQAETERAERLKVQETTVQLAEGVGQLAEKSAAITQEIRDNRPINANILYSDFLINRVPARFESVRAGAFGGELTRNATARTILVSDGTNTYAVMHIEDTVFNLYEPTSNWRQLRVTLSKNSVRAAASELRFLNRDPRIVAIPVGAAQAESLGVKVYRTTSDPFRFPEAVLISHGGEGYGEVPFKLEPDLAGYLSMDNRLIRRLAGEFTASRGDLVLSKSGELLGIMVNTELCVMIDSFAPAGTIRLGDVSSQPVAELINTVKATSERRVLPRRGR